MFVLFKLLYSAGENKANIVLHFQLK